MTMSGGLPMATAAQRGGQGVDRERMLSDLERDKYEDLLRKLTVGGWKAGRRRKRGSFSPSRFSQ